MKRGRVTTTTRTRTPRTGTGTGLGMRMGENNGMDQGQVRVHRGPTGTKVGV